MRDCRDNIHYEIGMYIHWVVARVYHSRTCLIVPDSWHGDDRNNRHSFVSFYSHVYVNEIQRAASIVLSRKQMIALKYTALL